MALHKLVSRNYDRKLPGSIKYQNPHSFKEGMTWTTSLIFHYLIEMNTYMQNLSACNSGQYIYVSGYITFSLFFKI